MVLIDQKQMERSQAYETRGIISKFFIMGYYQQDLYMKQPIYKFLTLDRGQGFEPVPVEFVRIAPFKEVNGEKIIDTEKLKEGDFVVSPGFVYKKCLWFDNLRAEHLKSYATYKPKEIIEADKADEPAVELGTIDATTDQVTKK